MKILTKLVTSNRIVTLVVITKMPNSLFELNDIFDG